jgi:hypothetical protein
MTEEEIILWEKISLFKLDELDSSFKFSNRLARENGWSITFSEKVIEEYKKFMFLCCISETGVTPSDQVDQAWHLHLTYTKSYWIDFCKNTLSKEIHHNPTKGGNSEREKFDDYYTKTLNLYIDKFQCEPPKSIWPNNEKRFSDINFQRVNLKNHWLLPKPVFKNKSFLFLVLLVSILSIQAYSKNEIIEVIILIIIVLFLINLIFNNKKNDSGCSGCSPGGCSDHSGCGGDSGCSGCGGD